MVRPRSILSEKNNLQNTVWNHLCKFLETCNIMFIGIESDSIRNAMDLLQICDNECLWGRKNGNIVD